MSEEAMKDGESQARRLEVVLADIEAMVSRPDVAQRLRVAPGEQDWNAMQTIGHVVEVIPYWLNHCRTLIAAEGEPPAFGRTLDSPERLEGVQRVEKLDLGGLMLDLRREVQAGAAMIRGLTPEERAKQGVHNRLGLVTVDESVESFVVSHCEAHVAQIREALGL